MARAPKVCAHPGCTNLTTTGRCTQHPRPHGWGRGNPRTSTPQHRAWRRQVLDRAGWWCQIQYPGICVGHATIADHIVATAFGGPEYDLDNGQAACRPCHNRKSAIEGNLAKERRRT